MKRHTGTLAAMATATAVALTGTVTLAGTAQAAQAPKERSLVKVLTADGNHFDRNGKDFDIVTEAALAVVKAKPDSPVAVLADGSTRVTAFVPTDNAFRKLAKDLTGKRIKSEKRIFNTLVRTVGVDTIEDVLLYHVVAGKTLTSTKVLKSGGNAVRTALGPTIRIKVGTRKARPQIILVDKDRDDRNPRVVLRALDLNKGNKQVAHGINKVLRPVDL